MLFSLCANVNNRKLSRFVFQSVRKKMGGHLDYCVSGGAALDKEIGEGLRTLGLDVLEGYGMTETAPMISFTRPGDIIPGCAGRPLPCITFGPLAQSSPSTSFTSTQGNGRPAQPGMMSPGRVKDIMGAVSVMP